MWYLVFLWRHSQKRFKSHLFSFCCLWGLSNRCYINLHIHSFHSFIHNQCVTAKPNSHLPVELWTSCLSIETFAKSVKVKDSSISRVLSSRHWMTSRNEISCQWEASCTTHTDVIWWLVVHYRWSVPEMESLRPWTWPRGTSRTIGHVLVPGGQVLGLGLGLGRSVVGLEKHVLGLKYFSVLWLKLTVNFITNFGNPAIKMKLVITSPAINVCVLKFWLNSEPYWHWPWHRPALACLGLGGHVLGRGLEVRVVALTPNLVGAPGTTYLMLSKIRLWRS